MMVRGRDWSGRRLACTVRGTRGGRVVGTGVSSKPQNHECGRHSSERQPVDDAETAVVISRRRGRWHSLAVRVDCGDLGPATRGWQVLGALPPAPPRKGVRNRQSSCTQIMQCSTLSRRLLEPWSRSLLAKRANAHSVTGHSRSPEGAHIDTNYNHVEGTRWRLSRPGPCAVVARYCTLSQ